MAATSVFASHHRVGAAIAGSGIVIVSGLWALATPHMAVAGAIFFLYIYGLSLRKSNVRLHAGVMSLGIGADISLVLLLQLQRGAVQTAVHEALNLAQQVHIGASLTAVLLYVPTLILGSLLLRRPELRARYLAPHKRVAVTAFVLRAVGLLTMYSMLERH